MAAPLKVKASDRTKAHFGLPSQPINKPVENKKEEEIKIVEKLIEVIPVKRKWKFEVERDWEGLIKTVIVSEI